MTKTVTLDRINDFTKDEIFEFVRAHLLSQNQRAVVTIGRGTGCVYRTPEGLSCAVGCMVPEDQVDRMISRELNEYTNTMDLVAGMSWSQPTEGRYNLLRDLQRIHDTFPPHEWEARLEDFKKSEYKPLLYRE